MTLTGQGGNATIDTAGHDVTLSGALSGVGGLNKIGSGTLTISASNHYSGGTYVSEGVLSVGNTYALGPGSLIVSGTGSAKFGSYGLYVSDSYSGISGGSLACSFQYIGVSGTGTFTQTAGTNTISNMLSVGYNSGQSGTYSLSGTGQLSAIGEIVGDFGVGTFTQTDGLNSSTSGSLDLGLVYHSSGSYNLEGMGQVSMEYEYIGYSGTGIFTQSGGANRVSTDLHLARYSGSSGTYTLNGGRLITKSLTKGSGSAAFNFGGGTLQASGSFTTTVPMTLTGEGGNANIDTAGFTVTLSGAISGAGGLNKIGSGSLEFAGGIDVSDATLIDVQAGKAVLRTVSVNKSNLNINTAALATFEIVNGSNTVGAVWAVERQ